MCEPKDNLPGTARQKILMVGPMPGAGQYIGGIAILIGQILQSWSLPYPVVFYNTEGARRDYSKTGQFTFANIKRFFGNAFGLLRAARRERPQIVHYHTSRLLALLKDLLVVWLLKRVTRCQVIGHIHWASYATLLAGSSPAIRGLQIRLLASIFDHLILMSQNIKSELADKLPPGRREKFMAKSTVLYNFTTLPDLAMKREPTPGPVKVFFIGNVGPSKGIVDLIAGAGLLRQQGQNSFHLVLAGPFDDAATETAIRRQVEEAKLTDLVQFTGAVSGEAKVSLFQKADIFALPSYGEGLPMSLLEAMSYALPSVATAVGGIPEALVDGESGLLIQPGQVPALAEALKKLLLSPDLRKAMGQSARARIEQQHSPAHYLSGLGKIYGELLTGQPALSHH